MLIDTWLSPSCSWALKVVTRLLHDEGAVLKLDFCLEEFVRDYHQRENMRVLRELRAGLLNLDENRGNRFSCCLGSRLEMVGRGKTS